MKPTYRKPHVEERTLSTINCIAVSIGGGSEQYPIEYPDGGLFEELENRGELPW